MADALNLVLLLCFSSYIFVCPFTKVEESFNLQATHDILYHGFNISAYDHLEYPGVVPRTFLGPLLLSAVTYPVVQLIHTFGTAKLWSLYGVRFALGALVLCSFSKFRDAVFQKFGSNVSHLLALITATQFHFLFYISRPLPNVFALSLVLLALRYWLLQRHAIFIWLSAFSIIIFRSELCILLGLVLLLELFSERIPLRKVFAHSVLAGVIALALTVSVDSLFWRALLWPEGKVLWFNTFLNKSSKWGTAPFLWYFYSVIPRALLSAVVLIPLGLWRDRRTWILASPALGFVLLYSLLPHKELRFIIYVFPLLNTVAACGLNFIFQSYQKWKPVVRVLVISSVVGGLLCNCLTTAAFLYASRKNYPGGHGLYNLHWMLQDTPDTPGPVYVHICVAAAETGVSRFLELNSSWRYSKVEGMEEGAKEMLEFSHLITEAPCTRYASTHFILEEISGFTGVAFDVKSFPYVFRVLEKPKLCVLERRTWRNSTKNGRVV